MIVFSVYGRIWLVSGGRGSGEECWMRGTDGGRGVEGRRVGGGRPALSSAEVILISLELSDQAVLSVERLKDMFQHYLLFFLFFDFS